MVGVVGLSPIAPTNILQYIKHPVVTLGAFFMRVSNTLCVALSNWCCKKSIWRPSLLAILVRKMRESLILIYCDIMQAN
jgi:hypothetical protein